MWVREKLTISIYPNPVKDILVVQHPKADANSTINIVGTGGQILQETKTLVNAVTSTLNINQLPAGKYSVHLQLTL